MIRIPPASLCAAFIALAALASSGCGSSSSGATESAGASGKAGGASNSSGAGGATAGTAGAALGGAGSGGDAGASMPGSAGASAGSSGSAGVTGVSGAGSGGSAGSSGGAFSVAAAGSFLAWPGGNAVTTVDPANTYASDLSGLQYEPAQGAVPAVLWAVQNGPSKLYRLLYNGTNWVSDTSNGWGSGKTLHFPNGTGTPDSEAVTKLAFGTSTLYVSTERDNQDLNVSRLSVLSFDGSSADSTLNATHEWNLTGDQPQVGPNLGLEGLAWIPDAYLVAKGFLDENSNAAYDPAHYANHAGGIFLVGVEQTGMIYGYALDHVGGGFTRVATILSGQMSVMELAFDREVGYLWSVCDDTCMGRINLLDIDTRAASPTRGKFVVRQGFERPSTMPNLNNEGFSMAAESTCQNGFKSAFYSDDSSTGGHAIRRDSIPCGPFL